jgi:hypothetical protein
MKLAQLPADVTSGRKLIEWRNGTYVLYYEVADSRVKAHISSLFLPGSIKTKALPLSCPSLL